MFRLLSFFLLLAFTSRGQSPVNLLLNGGFEDINTCTEYDSECGVEGWFYLKDVKAQMLLNEENTRLLGANSYGLFVGYRGYNGFYPLIGTPLPCGLVKGKRYTFSGLISATVPAALQLVPGVSRGAFFYVPKRSFSTGLVTDSLRDLEPVRSTSFFRFRHSWVATGEERYLTFGIFIFPDTTANRRLITGTPSISVVLDDFRLEAADPLETHCAAYEYNRRAVYEYNYRHREMDYALFGRGFLPLEFNTDPLAWQPRQAVPPAPPKADTILLGDVLFDFNKATLKPAALTVLESRFPAGDTSVIDSLYIEGHTDSIGTTARNLELSRERAEAVRQWLESRAVPIQGPLRVTALGSSRPVAGNRTAAGRALNRRVELIVFRTRKSG